MYIEVAGDQEEWCWRGGRDRGRERVNGTRTERGWGGAGWGGEREVEAV